MHERFYTIEKPKESFPSEEKLKKILESAEAIAAIAKIQEDYLPWSEFRKKSWATDSPEDVWAIIKFQRHLNSNPTPIRDKEGKIFNFNPKAHLEFLHQVDLELGGNFMGIGDFSEVDRRRFIRRNLIEESIASSQLEGANTSRSAAKAMLRQQRQPKDKSEQMIVNNHETMRWIEEELKFEELSLDMIFELHRKITYNTIDEQYQGVLRNTLDSQGDPLVIKPWDDQIIAYETPSKEFVEKNLPLLIKFANDQTTGPFIHPVIKAILIHFWMGLLHPFEDGNGRLARVLFYWYMLKKEYWAFSYLSLSEIILKSPKQYAMAYIYTEQDNNDLNYFIHYNITKLKLARTNFEKYVQRKISENRDISEIVRLQHNLNHRQVKLIHYLEKNEQRFATPTDYGQMNPEVGKLTIYNDLKKLVEENFLTKIKKGRNTYYYPTNKAASLLKAHP